MNPIAHSTQEPGANAGSTLMPAGTPPPPDHPHGYGEPGGFRVRLLQASPLFLKAAVMDPLRLLLRPLAHWLMQPHLALHGEEADSAPVPVNLKPTSLLTLVLSVLLGPLVFVMLLPLLLILVPAFILMALIGTLAASHELAPVQRVATA